MTGSLYPVEMLRPPSAELGRLTLGSLSLVSVLTALAYLDSRRQLALDFGYEYGNIAAALADGRGFSDPHQLASGPTAWMPPLLSWLMALTFMVLGNKTFEAALALSLFKLVSLTWTMVLLALEARTRAPALVAWKLPLLFALGLAANSSWLASDLSDPWLGMLVCALLLRGLSQAWCDRVGSAVVALVSPALALAQIVLLCLRRQKARLLVLLLVAGGWCLRGGATVGLWAPIKSNGGFEFYQAHQLSPDGLLSSQTLLRHHPIQARSTLRSEFRDLGEAAFCRKYMNWSWDYLGQRPLDWAAKAGRRGVNAFLYVEDPNDVRLGRPVLEEDRWQLEESGLILSTSRGFYWLCLSWEETEMLEALAGRSLLDPERVLFSWKDARRRLRRDRSSWTCRLWGFVFAGLPSLALVAGFLRGFGRRPAFYQPALLYVVTLLPYVCISHYARYQLALLPLQCWLVWYAFCSGREEAG